MPAKARQGILRPEWRALMPLSNAQKHARKVIREAARRLIAELDSRQYTDGCTEFQANFHLECIRYDRASYMGQPAAMSWPIYVPFRSIQQTPGA